MGHRMREHSFNWVKRYSLQILCPTCARYVGINTLGEYLATVFLPAVLLICLSDKLRQQLRQKRYMNNVVRRQKRCLLVEGGNTPTRRGVLFIIDVTVADESRIVLRNLLHPRLCS